ncbi:MAG: response regulator [Candidatus Hydrogenedentes bacterium]|nr:response regulator [Candidatus Hydrogenedentota bacterium]
MIENTILAVIIALQITTALFAIRLFWSEGRSRAWLLVILIFVLIGFRRSTILLFALPGSTYAPQQLLAELVVLFSLSLLLLLGVFGMHYFIKRLETANETLRKQGFVFRSMVENIPGAVYRGNVDTDSAMSYVSDTIEVLTGYPATDFIDNKVRSFGSVIHEEDTSIWYSRQKNIAEKIPYEIRYRLRHVTGHILHVQEKGCGVWDESGTLLWLNGFIWDITERIEAEETRLSLERQVQHTQKLKSLGVLSGGVAHDFNNLLMAILGHSELALIELNDTAPACSSVKHIQKSAYRAAELCRQLLAYSGRGAFEIKRIGLHHLVLEILELLKTSVSKKVRLDINLPEDLPSISGDTSQITQIIMNLITNASESINDNAGTITVTGNVLASTDDIPVGAFISDGMPHGRYICIDVTDTGCGMSLETMDRIFEPFFTTKVTGRGLGMAAVMGIVHSHKGALWLTSEEEVGTTFRVFFPVAKKLTNSTTFMVRSKPNLWKGSGLILLVDDEEELLQVGEKMLSHIGFEVITATNGREALEVFKTRKDAIEAVLLDLTMPDMDGKETFCELKKLDENVKVIIVSGFSLQEIEERFNNMGLLGALHKPYSMKTLKETLQSHFDESSSDEE